MAQNKLLVMVTIIIFTLLSLANAAVSKNGPCPDVKPVKYLNLTTFAHGVWYEIAKYPNDLENRGDCTYLAFQQENGVIKFQLGEVAEKVYDSMDGYVNYAPDAGTSGLLFYNSYTFVEKEKSSILPVYILTVDYDRYFVGYVCKYDEAIKKRHEFAWIGSRTKKLDAKTKAEVDKFLKTAPVIETNKFTWDKFDDATCKTAN